MKNIFVSLAVVASFFVVCIPANAHELIPRALQEFVAQNPSATAEEIQAFAQMQAPELAEEYKSGEEILALVRDQDTTTLDNALDFFVLGVEHILGGADHILFVLAILLVFVGIWETLTLSVIFTIAHSITLVLSGLGLLTIPTSITEPLIALSIGYVAITSVFFKNNKYTGGAYSVMGSIFFFGLFHGLGFAGLLQEIQIPADKYLSSLFSFNVGIEAGQLLIIALALPFIYACRNKKWYPTFTKVFAAAIAVLAFFWFIQRVFFS